MLKEEEFSYDDQHVYKIRQLPLTKSQDLLAFLMGLAGRVDDLTDESGLIKILGSLKTEDIHFLRRALFGDNCAVKNGEGDWAPLGEQFVENHFSGRIGAMLHLLGKCILVNYGDFLKDLRLDELVSGLLEKPAG